MNRNSQEDLLQFRLVEPDAMQMPYAQDLLLKAIWVEDALLSPQPRMFLVLEQDHYGHALLSNQLIIEWLPALVETAFHAQIIPTPQWINASDQLAKSMKLWPNLENAQYAQYILINKAMYVSDQNAQAKMSLPLLEDAPPAQPILDH